MSLALSPIAATSLSVKPPLVSTLRTTHTYLPHRKNFKQRKVRNGKCRAEFSHDAPFGIAIGACILNSLAFPIGPDPEDDNGDSVIDTADARFAVMGIISFIPYFNWLSWVFAWLDTGKRRYAVYAIVYLAPYLRANLSLSPEESWLPIAGILLCIIHVQLEASIKNGDIQGFQLLGEVAKYLSSITTRKENGISKEEKVKDDKKLPSAQEHHQNDIQRWGIPKEPFQDPEYSDKREADDEWEK